MLNTAMIGFRGCYVIYITIYITEPHLMSVVIKRSLIDRERYRQNLNDEAIRVPFRLWKYGY